MPALECPDKVAGGSSHGMDTGFFVESRHRIELFGLGMAALSAVVFGTTLLFFDLLGWEAPPNLFSARVSQLSVVALSLGLYGLTKSAMCPRRILSLTRVYQLLGAVMISYTAYANDVMLQPAMHSISWLALWILLIPIVAPACPLKNLISALLCATVPVAMFTGWMAWHGHAWPPTATLVSTFLPNYIVAALTLLPVMIILRISRMRGRAEKQAKALGSYQLVEKLGAGGMGEVWRAEHRMLARPAAVKVIKPSLLDAGGDGTAEESLQRFEREARATAQLSSPHTVGLYDFGITAEGSFYYVMELLQGVDLESLVMRHGALPPGRVIHVLRQACASLAEAHAAGMVHRDIKPANMFVCRVGMVDDFLKILDFGLVACDKRKRPDDTDARLTQRGIVVGTPAYMAPEQADGYQPVDHRADIYALGCVAYFLLTGRLVFEQKSSFHMMVDHMKTEPVPPSDKAGTEIPADLEQLVLSCLAKDPADRPQSALELDERLADCQLSSPWRSEQSRRWWKQHRPLPEPVAEDTRATMPSPVLLTAR